MFLADFEVKYCDFYQKEIVCESNCNSCKLQQFVNIIYEDHYLSEEEEEEQEDSDSDLILF